VLHPHPLVPLLTLPAGERFSGLIIQSGSLKFDSSLPSFAENAYRDVITTHAPVDLHKIWLGEYKSDEYAEAATASPEWWKGAPFRRTLCIVGEHELLRDTNKMFFDNYKVYRITCEAFVETFR
jgi:hypothetical protein